MNRGTTYWSVYRNFAGKGRDSEIAPTENVSVFVGGNSDSRLSKRSVAIRRSLLQKMCQLIYVFHYKIRSVLLPIVLHPFDYTPLTYFRINIFRVDLNFPAVNV